MSLEALRKLLDLEKYSSKTTLEKSTTTKATALAATPAVESLFRSFLGGGINEVMIRVALFLVCILLILSICAVIYCIVCCRKVKIIII